MAVAHDPAMLVLRRVPATPFFQVRHLIGSAERDRVAWDLAAALAKLHDSRGAVCGRAGGRPPAGADGARHDALWRAEAGIALPDKRTPAQWVDDLTTRFTALKLG